MRTIQNGDVEISTESFGSDADPALILIMGATASMLWWPDQLCADLAGRGLFVVRYDLRDTGQSTTGAPGAAAYGPMDLEADLMTVMDSYGIEKAHLAGMSLGGLIAQIAALCHPQRVLSLTLVGAEPVGGVDQELPGIDDRFMSHFNGLADLDWGDRDAVRRFLLGVAELSAGLGRPFDQTAALKRIDGELDRAINIQSAFNHALMSGATEPGLRVQDIGQPVLVLHGSDDPILPLPNGQAIAASVPDGRIIVLAGTGHELVAEDIPQIVSAITGFVQEAGASPQ